MQPYLQGTSVRVVLPQPRLLSHSLSCHYYCGGNEREREVFIPPLGMVHSWYQLACSLGALIVATINTYTERLASVADRLVAKADATDWCSYKVKRGCYLLGFSCSSNSHRLDLHNKTHVALPNVWWKHMQKLTENSTFPDVAMIIISVCLLISCSPTPID